MMEKDKLKAVNENIILDLVKVVLFVTVGTLVDYNFIYESWDSFMRSVIVVVRSTG